MLTPQEALSAVFTRAFESRSGKPLSDPKAEQVADIVRYILAHATPRTEPAALRPGEVSAALDELRIKLAMVRSLLRAEADRPRAGSLQDQEHLASTFDGLWRLLDCGEHFERIETALGLGLAREPHAASIN
jgi:hypothetical protein